MDDRLATALTAIDGWGTEHAAAAVVGPDRLVASHGDAERSFRWASVTKPVTALAVLLAVENGLLDLDEPAGPSDSTVRHLLAHTSGLPFEGTAAIGRPGSRRIYSESRLRSPGGPRVGADRPPVR
ncbi:MAG: serine hydrolase domain-containing protein [Candidatus Limnocylindrales bacterium]